MFRKASDVSERNKSLLRKKEVNKLRFDVSTKFGRLEEDEIAQIFPSKANVEQSKLMNKTLLYYLDGIPYFFDEGGRNKLFPTLQLLWRFPNALRTFVIHSQVSKFVLNGADLMLPGVSFIDNLEGIEVGEVCAVRVWGNPLPFAIGQSLCSWEGILANNGRGKALTIASCFNDLLSEIGMNFTSQGPNSGFLCNAPKILPLEGYDETVVIQMATHAEEDEDMNGRVGEGGNDFDNDVEDNENIGAVEEEGTDSDDDANESKDGFSSTNGASQRRVEFSIEQREAMGIRLRNALVLLLKHILRTNRCLFSSTSCGHNSCKLETSSTTLETPGLS